MGAGIHRATTRSCAGPRFAIRRSTSPARRPLPASRPRHTTRTIATGCCSMSTTTSSATSARPGRLDQHQVQTLCPGSGRSTAKQQSSQLRPWRCKTCSYPSLTSRSSTRPLLKRASSGRSVMRAHQQRQRSRRRMPLPASPPRRPVLESPPPCSSRHKASTEAACPSFGRRIRWRLRNC